MRVRFALHSASGVELRLSVPGSMTVAELREHVRATKGVNLAGTGGGGGFRFGFP